MTSLNAFIQSSGHRLKERGLRMEDRLENNLPLVKKDH